ncbi:hypothetical protein KCX82_19850 [Clostridiales bacterium BAD-6]|uniref:Uncharacterized protein n=1 Tax=Sinanaerobacter chloroacetimidivorans TaxID=2818044 RepID=A0A8J8B3V7_9FIRM|nr:hypothetical protein [Sinanaerobacter chloroacetimidivorans]
MDSTDYYIDHTTPQSVSPSGNYIGAVTVSIKYARLRVQAPGNVSVVAYYNGRA